MANKAGHRTHGTKGGKYARKRMLDIDFSCFYDYLEKIEKLGGDLQRIFTEAMEEAGKKVQEDTEKAIENQYLPAKGKYRRTPSKTADSIIKDPKTVWRGSEGTIDLGFDKTKPGAGGFLITGTPKMQPDLALQKIYGGKTYERKIKKQIEERLQKELDKLSGGNDGRS